VSNPASQPRNHPNLQLNREVNSPVKSKKHLQSNRNPERCHSCKPSRPRSRAGSRLYIQIRIRMKTTDLSNDDTIVINNLV
jgi:hypothetical protein